jgi:DNA-binding NarL/FixJ family response regulator
VVGKRQFKVVKNELTPREEEVLKLLVLTGKTNPELAELLGCSARTIKTHLHSIMQKTGVHSRTELVIKYMVKPQTGPRLIGFD